MSNAKMLEEKGLEEIIKQQKKEIDRLKAQVREYDSLLNKSGEHNNFLDSIVKLIINKSIQSVWVKALDLRYLYGNELFLKSLGDLKLSDVLGKKDSELYDAMTAKRYSQHDIQVLESCKIIIEEMDHFDRNGEKRRILAKKGPLIYNGEIYGVWGMHEDLTEKRRLEAKEKEFMNHILNTQKMESLGEIAGALAHNFNNQLAAIQGYGELMALNNPNDAVLNYFKKMKNTVKKAEELSNRLVFLTGQNEIKLEYLDISEILENNIKSFNSQIKDVSIIRKYQQGLWAVNGDYAHISQAFVNLISNALDALLLNNKEIKLETENKVLTLSDTECQAGLAEGKYVAVSISDTGIGMDENVLQKIFEPFFNNKSLADSSGLGLTETYAIMRSHKGDIKAESIPGKGSKFIMYFPAADSINLQRNSAEDSMDHLLAKPGEKILVVDDEELVRDIASRLLQHYRYEVITAGDGSTAIDKYKQENPSLVILDIGMKPMSGVETYNILKDYDPGLKVIISSGYRDGHINNMLQISDLQTLSKPYKKENLAKTVRLMLDGKL